MTRWIAAMMTGLVSLVAIGYGQDDPTPEAKVPQEAKEEKAEVKKRFEVKVFRSDEPADPADTLSETYEILKRLRAEKLEGRSKLLLDRAVEMYRQAVARHGSDNEAEAKSAATQAVAALEMARTVERMNDLPPPPGPRKKASAEERPRVRRLEIKPPALEDEPEKDEPRQSKKRIVITRPGGEGKDEVMVFEGDDHDLHGLPEAIGDLLDVDVKVDEDKIRELTNQLYDMARNAAEQALGGPENAERALEWVMGDNPELARNELERAYDKIVEARAELTDPKDRFYLDAARDLYNKARKEAEAGRNGRAVELARAAAALTLVPNRPDADTEDNNEEREEEVIRFLRPERGRDVEKEIRKEASREREEANETRKEERRVRVEVKPREDSPATGGLGLAFSFEDGVLKVEQVLPGTPAAKDGRIKPGDRILGIAGENGERLLFNDKSREEIVDLLRGKPGSKVSVIVNRGPDDKSELVEMTREQINFPEMTQEEAAEAVLDAIRGLPAEPREAEPVEPLPPAIP